MVYHSRTFVVDWHDGRTDLSVGSRGGDKRDYIHQKSSVDNAVPPLFVHGCKSQYGRGSMQHLTQSPTGPGHFLEVRKMLPILTAVSSDHPSFHGVALSLPGFGFSEAPEKKGFAGPRFAEVCTLNIGNGRYVERLSSQVGNKLMLALGYEEYDLSAHILPYELRLRR